MKLLVVLLAFAATCSCRCNEKHPEVDVQSSPEASVKSPVEVETAWIEIKTSEQLDRLVGRWGNQHGSWAAIDSAKTHGRSWTSPYYYTIRFGTPESTTDCGIFRDTRVAFCKPYEPGVEHDGSWTPLRLRTTKTSPRSLEVVAGDAHPVVVVGHEP